MTVIRPTWRYYVPPWVRARRVTHTADLFAVAVSFGSDATTNRHPEANRHAPAGDRTAARERIASIRDTLRAKREDT